MAACRPLLGCGELAELRLEELVGQGSTKSVYRALWRGREVALSTLADPRLRPDFQHGQDMLLALGPSEHVVQLVGFCRRTDVVVTEFQPLGDATRVVADVQRAATADGPAEATRLALRFCRSYAAALSFLHDSPAGRRVMCDSSRLPKTLQQFLVTRDRRLVVADLDALPDAARAPVLCGRRPLEGDFVAPEQRWQHGVAPPGYDEKTDVWKLAAVCRHFLKAAPDGEFASLQLHGIHKRCRSNEPGLRPTAREVISEYERVLRDLSQMGPE